eukprot:1014238-Amphidinium_carterae.1
MQKRQSKNKNAECQQNYAKTNALSAHAAARAMTTGANTIEPKTHTLSAHAANANQSNDSVCQHD